jgi:hypothetical protein
LALLSDSIVERRAGLSSAAFEYQIGTEGVAVPSNPLALWMAASAIEGGRWPVVHHRPGSPGIATDADWRRAVRQGVHVDGRIPEAAGCGTAIVKLEYRVDDSRGPGGGFFTKPDVKQGTGLTPVQHLFIISSTFDRCDVEEGT